MILSDSGTPYNATLVLVDDETEILEILEARFRGVVERLVSFSDPSAALEFVRTHSVDAMLMDLKMSGMDGLTLFGEVLKVQPATVGIFLTGFGDKVNVQTALKMGAFDFIDKPFNDKLLIASIKRALERAQSEKLIREILEVFLKSNTQLDHKAFDLMTVGEKEKALRAALGLARVRLENLRTPKAGN